MDILSFTHVKVLKGDRWIAVRTPLTMGKLRRFDERIRPDYVYYTQGRFFRPWLLRSKVDRNSFFLFQDRLIVDIDEWTPKDAERVAEAGRKVVGELMYTMFTGNGLHLCFRRKQKEVAEDPWEREAIAAKNNAEMLGKIREESNVAVDLLPEPRHVFKIPKTLKYGNRGLKVWWGPEVPPPEELMKFRNRTQQRERAEEPERAGPPRPSLHFGWTNNVYGTRAFVLFCRCGKAKAREIAEKYKLKNSFYFDCEVPYLCDITVVNRERIRKILRREDPRSYVAFVKYGFLLNLLEGDVEEVVYTGKGPVSRGHAFYLVGLTKNPRIRGNTGALRCPLHFVRLGGEKG
jgi:hypothetical protein